MKRRVFTKGLLGSAVAAASAQAISKGDGLTYIGWSHDEAANRATLVPMFENFRRANPGVTLETIGVPYGQMQQAIQLKLKAGEPIAIFQLTERWLPQFASTGRLVDFNSILGKPELEKLMTSASLRLGQFKSKQIGLPWTAGSIGMVANEKVLAQAGVTQIPQTIEEFQEVLRSIKRSQPGVVPYAMATKNSNTLAPDFQVWLWTFGGQLFSERGAVLVDSPAGIRALTFMSDLVREGLASKDVDRPEARRLFAQHQTCFYNDAPLARGFGRTNSGLAREFDQFIRPIPTPVIRKGDPPQSFAWGHLLALVKGDKLITKASPQVALAQHLALNEANALSYFYDQGLFPVTQSALSRLAGDAYVTEWLKGAINSRRDETSNWSKSADLLTIIGEEVQAALLGQKQPKSAIQSMSRRLETKLWELPRFGDR